MVKWRIIHNMSGVFYGYYLHLFTIILSTIPNDLSYPLLRFGNCMELLYLNLSRCAGFPPVMKILGEVPIFHNHTCKWSQSLTKHVLRVHFVDPSRINHLDLYMEMGAIQFSHDMGRSKNCNLSRTFQNKPHGGFLKWGYPHSSSILRAFSMK